MHSMENIENKEMTSAGQIIKELAQIQIEKKWDLCTAERNVRNYAFIPSHMKVCELSFLNAKNIVTMFNSITVQLVL